MFVDEDKYVTNIQTYMGVDYVIVTNGNSYSNIT